MTTIPARTASRPHCAKFSDPILAVLRRLVAIEQRRLDRPVRVLDPFAGVGRVHELAVAGKVETLGIEIEQEWAQADARTICADSLAWMAARQTVVVAAHAQFDLVVTSPCYGNRFSDSHNAQDGSRRRSYTHDLGRTLSAGSSGSMAWGSGYWLLHARAYQLMRGMLRQPDGDDSGGLLLLNVSSFYRQRELVPATWWHRGVLYGAGFVEDGRPRVVNTARLKDGENQERADYELIVRARPART